MDDPDATRDETAPGMDGAARLVGRLLSGKWRVDRLLGTGGMSLVYSATHRNGNRVALKVLRPELAADPRTRRRFLREPYLVNRVAHEGVVRVLDDNEAEDGTVFLVMDLLDGATLEELARDGACSPAEVASVGCRVLDVLVAAHAAGIVHRDVKPSNVFLERKGGVRLLDFGIARRLRDAGDQVTRDGALLGTPGYMAPEQARGLWAEVGARTDLWAVGATLFRLLTGRTVHEATTPEGALIAAATERAPSVASVRAAVPAQLAAIVDKALELDAKDRWSSALEMQGELERVRAQLPECTAGATLRVPERAPDAELSELSQDPSMAYVDQTKHVEVKTVNARRTASAVLAAFVAVIASVATWAAARNVAPTSPVDRLTKLASVPRLELREPARPSQVPGALARDPAAREQAAGSPSAPVAKRRPPASGRRDASRARPVESTPQATSVGPAVTEMPSPVVPLEDFLNERR
jgi:eukaryotic-like serine/threonine-protein kinase